VYYAHRGLYKPHAALQRQHSLVHGKLQLHAKELCPSAEKLPEIRRTQRSTVFVNDFNLFLEDGAGCIAGKDEEGADRALSSV
jgi:hypothetical protein